MEERANKHIQWSVKQIALTGTITHLHLWWQQPGRRANTGCVCVNWEGGPEWIVFHSQEASHGSHSHLNTDCMSFCYNWSQLLLKSEAFLFWGRLWFCLFGMLSLLCPHIWFATCPSLCSSCIKHPGSTLFEPNKQKNRLAKYKKE